MYILDRLLKSEKIRFFIYGTTFVLFLVISYLNKEFILAKITSLPFLNSITLLLFSVSISAWLYNKIVRKHPETRNGMFYIFWLFQISVLGLLFAAYSGCILKDYQTVFSFIITSIFVAAGWWVQDIISKTTSRRSHTLNVVMNQRNSSDFNHHVLNARTYLGTDKIVNEEIINYYTKGKKQELLKKECDKNEKLDNIISALDSLIYLINYYEFIAAGVRNRDLDAELLEKCFSGILISLEKRAFYLIYYLAKDEYNQNKNSYSYCELLTWIKSFNSESQVLKKLEKDDFKILNAKYVLTEDEIKDIFK
ncbi:DUF4760 domain-containing protein [Haemophilus sputorum]|uniref:DUF4760 domain-containing protein n=1 Tax=Haemophilus sputorum TaxID=1078480 RepID=UPI000248A857|nr:DUF4760 domain-containing protein [Haemophilus sputorum]